MHHTMKKLLLPTLLLALLTSCGQPKQKAMAEANETNLRTPETERLLNNLTTIHNHGYMFGHHDDTVYGIGWEGDSARSDVQSVCGDYPAVISFDLGHIELGDSVNLDNVPFDKIRQESINQYLRGGMISMSWHLDNPKTGSTSWDVSDKTVVASILPGGENHAKFMGWMEKLTVFLNSIQTADGTKVPILFRPWHEHTGSWFWWGQDLCSNEEYKALWTLTTDYLKKNGANHLLYAYSPGGDVADSTAYLERYPGDEQINVIGFDTYQFDKTAYLHTMKRSLDILTEVGKAHHKVMAVTETGYEGVPDAQWWTETLAPALADYPIAYVLVWRNAREKVTHFYAPYPGQVSAEDFTAFHRQPRTLFTQDTKELLYQ